MYLFFYKTPKVQKEPLDGKGCLFLFIMSVYVSQCRKNHKQ